MRVFVAGASGAIGSRLVPQLVERGHQVVGTARSGRKAELLRALGIVPERGVLEPGGDFREAPLLVLEVKDTSATRRCGIRRRPGVAPWR